MINIGEKIRIQRQIKNYSQEYMAFALEITQPAYSNLESNKTDITLQRVYEIAEILEISAFELMPKPKYGLGINGEYIWRTVNKLRKFWTANIRKRLREMPADLNGIHGDKFEIPNL